MKYKTSKADHFHTCSLGVNLGQVEAFSQLGPILSDGQYKYVGYALDVALAEARAVEGLPDQASRINRLKTIWTQGKDHLGVLHAKIQQERGDGGLLGELPSDPLRWTLDLGVAFGIAEAFAQVATDPLAANRGFDWHNKREWIRARLSGSRVTDIPAHAINAGVFTRVREITDFVVRRMGDLQARGQDAADSFKTVEVARRLFLEQVDPSRVLKAGAGKTPLAFKLVDGDVQVGSQAEALSRLANAGYGTGAPKGVHDNLNCRALVLKNGDEQLAIVVADLCLVYQDVIPGYPNLVKRVRDNVRNVTGIAQVLVVSTHTHCGIEPCPPTPYANLLDSMSQCIADAVILGAGQLDEAQLGAGRGTADQSFNRVRRTILGGRMVSTVEHRGVTAPNTPDHPPGVTLPEYLELHPNDPLDKEVLVLHVRRIRDKTTIASLVNYACHGVVLGANYNQISADFPGRVMDQLEESTLGGVGLFLQGAAGDVNPWYALTTDGELVAADFYEYVKRVGDDIAAKAIFAIQQIPAYSSDRFLSYSSRSVRLEPSAEDQELGVTSLAPEINTVTLGSDIALAAFPGELFTSLGLTVKYGDSNLGIAASPYPYTLVVGYSNDSMGYVPGENEWNTGAYGTVPRPGVCYSGRKFGTTLVRAALDLLTVQRG